MEYRPLGRTDLKVSSICLGTMTWGNQNSAEEGFAQRAAQIFHRDGFVLVRDCLTPAKLERVRAGCAHTISKMVELDPLRIGNRGSLGNMEQKLNMQVLTLSAAPASLYNQLVLRSQNAVAPTVASSSNDDDGRA